MNGGSENFLRSYRQGTEYGTPKGIRTPVTAVRGQRPEPLDDGSMGVQAGVVLYAGGYFRQAQTNRQARVCYRYNFNRTCTAETVPTS